MKTQKYKNGDLVRVAKNLRPSMSHFASDCDAIVIHSYADKYGGNNINSYCIHIKGEGQCAWYEECQLTLIESDRLDILCEWEQKAEKERILKSDMNWIFANGEEVLKGAHGSTISELGKYLGIEDLWGNSGEGFAYYINAMGVLEFAEPFLRSGDKQGYLDACKNY